MFVCNSVVWIIHVLLLDGCFIMRVSLFVLGVLFTLLVDFGVLWFECEMLFMWVFVSWCFGDCALRAVVFMV